MTGGSYSHDLLSAASAAVRRSRQMSRIGHLRNPVAVAVRNKVMRLAPAGSIVERLAPILAGDHDQPLEN
ncbi:hypothetical protein EV649_5002 [Kribbella sp. VKM Ac-2569]|uniref:hypothetical protein n=1 Tax=Kribbella sp. VKM Ac-2569 TaxID=2512220 RepID=UPI00102AD29E|nr:hypothetical protein [Kribbella sp. VKM Ac-2569]RZT17460.1 hypothetical protein EV649_5002 [Kribbella sp. VKM Ac-2569]